MTHASGKIMRMDAAILVEVVRRSPGIEVPDLLRQAATMAGTTPGMMKYGLTYAHRTGAIEIDYDRATVHIGGP